MNRTPRRQSRFFAQCSARVLVGVAAFLLGRLPVAAQCNWSPGLAITETCGNVGIGTTGPVSNLEVIGDPTKSSGKFGSLELQTYTLNNAWLGENLYNNSGLKYRASGTGGLMQFMYGNLAFRMCPSGTAGNICTPVDAMTIMNGGNVGIGTTMPSTKLHVVGDVTVTGNIAAKFQDLAEWVPTRGLIEAGSVVIVDSESRNGVVPSSRAYDTRVAGVISARPGMLLGEGGEGKVMVATTGRVKMKVDASRGAIESGDLLVTSDHEGYAMRSEPVSVDGVPIHRPGTLVGKALEPMEKGKQGEILVLLSLQ